MKFFHPWLFYIKQIPGTEQFHFEIELVQIKSNKRFCAEILAYFFKGAWQAAGTSGTFW